MLAVTAFEHLDSAIIKQIWYERIMYSVFE